MNDITTYIGIPFLDKGRDLRGCDCYGLVKLYYKDILNIEIPETNITADKPRAIMINYLKEISKNWKEISIPEQHCVVALCMSENHPKLVTHFAVMIDDRRLLHTVSKTNSNVMDIQNIRIKPFIKGFYKWQS